MMKPSLVIAWNGEKKLKFTDFLLTPIINLLKRKEKKAGLGMFEKIVDKD